VDAEERQAKINKRNKQLRDREINDIRKIAKNPEGRRLLWRVMAISGTFQIDSGEKRIVGLTLFNDIMETDPEIFIQMQNEYKSEQVSFKEQIPPVEEEV